MRPGYVGAVYMQTYTEDSVTIYEGLEGAVDAHKLAPRAGQSFHGVAKTTGVATLEQTEQLTVITLRPHVRGTEPEHIVDVATVAPAPLELGGLVRQQFLLQLYPLRVCCWQLLPEHAKSELH